MESKTIKFKDPLNHNNGWITLRADKYPNAFDNDIYPITWNGNISGRSFKVIQKELHDIDVSDFEWIDFPEEYSYKQGDIIEMIKEYSN